jgi:6-pyruvoyl-tetrahydropterin synthase related domain
MFRRREALVDAAGLAILLLALADVVRPALLFLPTIAAGGDMPCHYPTAAWFVERLLPHFKLHGWYPGAYLGQPLLLYYFPLPFLVMAALAPMTGLPVAFKLGSALGIFLLPLLAYAAFRLMGFRFPAPLLGAAAAHVFLFLEANPIWGGTLASTMTGEFAYMYGIGCAVLFLGVAYRAYSRGEGPVLPALALALTAFAHGYAVLWAGLSASYFLYAARRPLRTLRWLAAVAALAFALSAIALLPLLQAWGWTTPYDDPWIQVGLANLFPVYLAPAGGLALLGLLGTLVMARRTGGPDHRLLFLLHSALVAAALAAAAPALGVIDVRFVPFAQLAVTLAGGAALGLALRPAAARGLAALAVVLLCVAYADAQSTVCRSWVEYNYTGLEAKELWPQFTRLAQALRGTVNDPRVAVEYSTEHEKAGSIRMYETFPFFSGRSTLEGVYNQASLQTHFVYFLASELGEHSPNPFRSRHYSSFDPDNAMRHLRLLGASDVVAMSAMLGSAFAARDDVEEVAKLPPYRVFHLKGPGTAYVEPLAFEPVRASPRGFRDHAYRWFTRKPQSPVHLVFTDDTRFKTLERDPWLPPPRVPLPDDVAVQATLGDEEIRIHTSRPGHPLLVKVSWHPRWRAEGADGPWLVSPALMLVIPRQADVRLVYGRNWADGLGALGTLGALLLCVVLWRRRRASVEVRAEIPESCESQPVPRRWGALVPLGLLVALAAGRSTVSEKDPWPVVSELYEKASRAFADERFEDAAEFAREAVEQGADDEEGIRSELGAVQGESLLRLGRPAEALPVFDHVFEDAPSGPHAAQALFGSATALEALGQADRARTQRERLLESFPGTPWAARAGSPGMRSQIVVPPSSGGKVLGPEEHP